MQSIFSYQLHRINAKINFMNTVSQVITDKKNEVASNTLM